jgi:hypothetical protein
MLQQTQVVTVIAYYTRWMEAFPTLLSLSQASQESINAVWAGLGYYSRASRLSLGSKRVVKEFGGNMPETAKELEAIDGVYVLLPSPVTCMDADDGCDSQWTVLGGCHLEYRVWEAFCDGRWKRLSSLFSYVPSRPVLSLLLTTVADTA